MRAARIRKSLKLTQSDLAHIAGVEQPTISRFERGDDGITLRHVRSVAAALGVSISDLLLEEERDEVEDRVLKIFHELPDDRQSLWLEMAEAMLHQRQS